MTRKLEIAGLVVAILTLAGMFFVPEVRRALGRGKRARASSAASYSEGPKQAPTLPAAKTTVAQKSKTSSLPKSGLASRRNKAADTGTNHDGRASSSPAPRIQVNNAPNGIAISGGIVSNPTVNNFVPLSKIKHWSQRAGPAFSGRATVVVTFTVNHTLEIPAFAAVCSRPCDAVSYSVLGAAQGYFLHSASNPDIAGVVLNEPRPLGADLAVSLTFATKGTKPFSVLHFRVIPPEKVPPE